VFHDRTLTNPGAACGAPAAGSSEPKLTRDALGHLSRLTGLHSLACSARHAAPAQLAAALGALHGLSRLRLENLPFNAAPALAELAPRLRQLDFSLDVGPPQRLLQEGMEPPAGDDEGWDSFQDLPSLLPLSRLGGLEGLAAPWELFVNPGTLSHLSGLTSLSVDFHAETLSECFSEFLFAPSVLHAKRVEPLIR
jgi:hypothetical protein